MGTKYKAWYELAEMRRRIKKLDSIASSWSGKAVLKRGWEMWHVYHLEARRRLKALLKAQDHYNRYFQGTYLKTCLSGWKYTSKKARKAEDCARMLGEQSDMFRVEAAFRDWLWETLDKKRDRELVVLRGRVETTLFLTPAWGFWRKEVQDSKMSKHYAKLAASWSTETMMALRFHEWRSTIVDMKRTRIQTEMWTGFALRHGYGRRAFEEYRENVRLCQAVKNFGIVLGFFFSISWKFLSWTKIFH